MSSFRVAEIDSYFIKYFFIRLLFEFGIQFLRKMIVLNILLEQLNRYFARKDYLPALGLEPTTFLPASIYQGIAFLIAICTSLMDHCP